MRTRLELCLFAAGPDDALAAGGAGVDALIVDWESTGKDARQSGADTEVNRHTVDDLVAVAIDGAPPVICRIDGPDPHGAKVAFEHGAAEVLVPMVRAPEQVEAVLGVAAGRPVGILVETPEALACADDLAALDLARVYVGLNDLAIERGSTSIFDAIADGTVERLRRTFDVRFGFGGATPGAGNPVPAELLLAEMARLECEFTFLRRSYRRDLDAAGGHGPAVAAIRERFETALRRPLERAADDRRRLERAIAAHVGSPAG